MKKIFFLSLALLFLPSQVFAETSVKVKVNNNVSSSSDSTVNSNTNIRIEENGKVTTYSSDKPENVEVNSVNGVSEIKVNGGTVSPTPTQFNVQKEDEKNESIQEEKGNIIVEIITKGIKLLFSFFD